MKSNHTRVILAMLLGSFILVAQRASASRWSATASTCQPDGARTPTFFEAETNGPAVTFNNSTTPTGDIKFRCDVANPLDAADPSWITLTVGYQDPDGKGHDYHVTATLYEVNKSTGSFSSIAVFDSNAFSATGPTSNLTTFNHKFDFTNDSYWVTLELTRNDTKNNPSVWFVELN